MASPRTAASASFLVLLVVAALTSCTPTPAAEPTATKTAEAPTPSPSSSPVAEDADDVVFTILAKVRATDGTTMDISLIGHTPVPAADKKGTRLAEEFADKCAELDGYSVSDAAVPVSFQSLVDFGSSLMRIDYEVTPDGHTLFSPVDLELGSPYFAEIVSGDGVVPVSTNRTCTGGYQLTESGSGYAVSNFESGTTAPDPGQWVFGHYGFTVPFESGASIESCRVEVSDLAQDDVADVPGWEPGSDATGISCGTGYRGE